MSKKENKEVANINKGYIYETIRSPLVTEKSMKLSENNKVVFKVSPFANKKSIKEAVEILFKVKITSVNIINKKGKAKIFKGVSGFRNDTKKAIVTLEHGQNIDLGANI